MSSLSSPMYKSERISSPIAHSDSLDRDVCISSVPVPSELALVLGTLIK